MLCDARKESFEEVTVFGKTMLFTNNRIDPNTVPKGYHLYEVRHDDDMQGIPCEIGKKIIVNHWGTLISNKPIKLVKSAISNNMKPRLKLGINQYPPGFCVFKMYILYNVAIKE